MKKQLVRVVLAGALFAGTEMFLASCVHSGSEENMVSSDSISPEGCEDLDITGDSLSFPGNETIAKGKVRIKYKDFIVRCDGEAVVNMLSKNMKANGNVEFVKRLQTEDADSERMKIHCDQISINFTDKKPVEKQKKTGKEESCTAKGLGNDNELSKIICTGNVIILRKIYDQEEQKKGEHKSLSGRADYDVKAGKIYLTENNPVIYRGYDELRAKKITIWVDSERVDSEGNVQITVNQNLAPVEDKMEKK